MYVLTKEERGLFRQIAGFYGCKMKFKKGIGGVWYGKHIDLDTQSYSFEHLVSLFCHELGHFVNWKTGKYPIYHNPKNFNKMHTLFPDYGRLVRYSLNAEIYTEKVGKRLCKEWFPDVKYLIYYKNTRYCYEFLYGYNLQGVL